LNYRIIPRLDIKGPNLVKGIHLEGLRVLGKPETFAQYYYETGADELMYQDVVASLYNRNSLHEIVSRTARAVHIPLTVGGGLRSIDDIKGVLRAGADKVSLNTAVLKNPELIRDAAHIFGSSTIVVAIEAIRQSDGTYLAYTDNGREYTGIEALSWAKRVAELGAGEIVATSVDREGTGDGYDLAFTSAVAQAVPIPVIAHGGPGSLKDCSAAIKEGKADSIAIASMLHYDYLRKNENNKQNHEGEGNTEFLRKGKSFGLVEPAGIEEIKAHLIRNHLPCRFNGVNI